MSSLISGHIFVVLQYKLHVYEKLIFVAWFLNYNFKNGERLAQNYWETRNIWNGQIRKRENIKTSLRSYCKTQLYDWFIIFFLNIKDSLRVLMNNKIWDNFNVRLALDLNKRFIKNNLFYIYYYSINFFLSKKL